ncbi:MAG: DUF697 domain-containing protein [Bryobacteraceae bacterium]
MVDLARTLSPQFGRIVLITLLVLYAVVALVPVVLFVRLPRALRPPPTSNFAVTEHYLDRVRSRLAGNPCLTGAVLDDRAGVDAALLLLEAKADELIKQTATRVFVGTAVSQNGRLDALMVLVAQSRMIWQIAHLYHQRPALQDLVRLYGNVADGIRGK